MAKYRVSVEWKNLSVTRGSRSNNFLSHRELDAFLDGLDYGVAHGKPDKITVTPILREMKKSETD